MRHLEKLIFFTFFPFTIFMGSLLLSLPAAYGNPETADLAYIDALFTAASAVCVTGLITVDTASYTLLGQGIILFLIQAGGLGIISLSTLFLVIPGKKISLKSRKMIKGYYFELLEVDPRKIVRNIVLMTLGIEALGTGLLYMVFRQNGMERPFFTSLFHAVSGFCNAGFSTFSDSLEGFRDDPFVLSVIMVMIITGGLSFLVIHELFAIGRGKKRFRSMSLHAKAVLLTSIVLIVTGLVIFLRLEKDISFLSALFQSVTPRTAGFNSIPQSGLSEGSKVITMFLMLVGGAPGSIAGGIKVTTLFLLFFMIVKRPMEDGSIQLMKRNIPGSLLSGAAQFLVKALALLFLSVIALTITESYRVTGALSFMEIVFETVSAFGTVGLSLGLTSDLSTAGKAVIIWTMFAGRVGLITMAMPVGRKVVDFLIQYPEGEIMIG